jgi:hypothetical protein
LLPTMRSNIAPTSHCVSRLIVIAVTWEADRGSASRLPRWYRRPDGV